MPLPTNNSRPAIPYNPIQVLPNHNRYGSLGKSPPTARQLDGDFNGIIDLINALAGAINNTAAGIFPGADNPLNANRVPTTDGLGHVSWVKLTPLNITDNLIQAQHIHEAAVTRGKIQVRAVGTNQLDDEAVITAKIEDDAITTSKINGEAVTTSKIKDNAVRSSKLADYAVTTEKVRNDAITLKKLGVDVMDKLNAIIPIGSIIEFAGNTALPNIWLECDGSAVSRTTYAALFAAIGTTYGSGNGSTTFHVPDRRGRVGVGLSSSNSTDGRITSATTPLKLGATFGAERVTLSTSQIPAHSHTIEAYGVAYLTQKDDQNQVVTGLNDPISVKTNSAGGGGSHNNVQPSLFMRYYIRAL